MAHRWVAVLKNAYDGNTLVFDTTSGVTREDGLPNQHRMWRLLKPGEQPVNPKYKYFAEVMPNFDDNGNPIPGPGPFGPWISYDPINSPPLVGDFNGDGLDDVLAFSWYDKSHMWIAKPDGTWIEQPLPSHSTTFAGQAARLASVTNNPNGKPDLIMSVGGYTGINRWYVHVIEAINEPPYFDFKFPFYSERLGTIGLDIEVVDANNDGIKDIYVIQLNNVDCNKNYGTLPTIDRGRDLLLVGSATPDGRRKFEKVRMESEVRGCGGLVSPWKNGNSLILANGNWEHVGCHYLLEWGV